MIDAILDDTTLDDLSTLLRLTPDIFAEVAASEESRDAVRRRVVDELRSDPAADEVFTRACCFEAPFGESWIHAPGTTEAYLSLEVASEALDTGRHRALLARVALSTSTALPYDYRAMAAERLLPLGLGDFRRDFEEAAAAHAPLPMRSLRAKATTRTDGIDHLFPIPETAEQRLALLDQACHLKVRESRHLIATRVLQLPEQHGIVPAYLCAEAEQLIARDAAAATIRPSDYLVSWDQELASVDGQALTLAELLRITLLCPEFKLPDARVRPALVSFYRSVLRISGRSIIGLSAGVFHVEHGTAAHPSYFYMGRDAVLGKGCVVDCVGGAVLQQGSFLGGGFMPILVHTHKHIRASGEPGVAERKKVLPCVFAAEAGARLPMTAIGLFETADYLESGTTPFPGIRPIALD
ncbi:hypothetical protein ACGFYQ_18810 [Streptomyces sp. NPDC048258]|uniref:hypothetical protein n=1 Tax=Streptomyces sp. NPDC048258 TaxID=3365527 RepID=UPI0037100743